MRIEDKYPDIYKALQEYIGRHIWLDAYAGGTSVIGESMYSEYKLVKSEDCLELDGRPPECCRSLGHEESRSLEKGIGAMPRVKEDFPDFPTLVKDKKTFNEVLLEHIKNSGMTNVQIYNNACMSKQSYSKIVYGDVIPKKSSILALAISLKLSVEDTEDLLKRAGHSLIESDLADTIVSYFIENETYDIYIINEFLEHYHQKLLGNVIR